MEMYVSEDDGENVLIGVLRWNKGGGMLIMKNQIVGQVKFGY